MRTLFLLLAFLSGIILSGCSEKSATQSTDTQSTEPTPAEQEESSPQQEALNEIAEDSFRQTTELLHLGHQLHIATSELLHTPTDANLKKAQTAYLALLNQWVISLPYINMTALTSSGAPLMNRLEKLPILPGYLDQIPDYPFSGLVHDIMLPIEHESLSLLHTLDNDEQVIFGLSAIEFLLFDHYSPDHYKKLVPMTTLSDEEAQEGILIEQLPNNRRRALLLVQANQLVEDLSSLHKRWHPTNGDDAKRFASLTGNNLKLTLTKTYQKQTTLLLDALNSIQEKPLILGRAHFAREERALLDSGIVSIKQLHESVKPVWELYPQTEKDEFDAVLNSLLDLHQQYQADPSNSLLLELTSNRCNQLLEISNELSFSPPEE
ncbi:imelysin family protein [Litoribrevibacter albus]|uniref:Imelysin-like domain-containing protein n=1 Tax=Litoribrevibacter albus TaxID=1473156 RepID=A0AA37SDH1_9GAMM|nr:imelysin family protein [Litoribrevibacter albus]GLQ33143.1 hypothetical protein GCM10007876_36220 [Litoribrevibacter albus]